VCAAGEQHGEVSHRDQTHEPAKVLYETGRDIMEVLAHPAAAAARRPSADRSQYAGRERLAGRSEPAAVRSGSEPGVAAELIRKIRSGTGERDQRLERVFVPSRGRLAGAQAAGSMVTL
jgi:hypothetical protein